MLGNDEPMADYRNNLRGKVNAGYLILPIGLRGTTHGTSLLLFS